MVETNPISAAFEAFFERWIIRQEHHLQQLIGAINGEDDERRSNDLVSEVITHYAIYFEAKAKIVEENVFLVLSPTWFSSFERAHLWIGGFKPGLVLRLVSNSVLDLTDDQSRRIDRLTAEIRREEKEVMDEFNRIEEMMVSPRIVELARHLGRLRNGAASDVDTEVDRLKVSMAVLVECADFLRMKTAVSMLEILRPTQAVRFLAAAAQLQLRLRSWGMQRDAENERRSSAAVIPDAATQSSV